MALKRDIAILETVPLFAAMDRDALRLVAFAGETKIVRAGDVLFRRGEMSDGGYVVTSGTVALDAADDGSPATVVATTGALIGELALIIDTARPATAIAREPSSVLKIGRSVFRRMLDEFPELAASVRDVIAARTEATAGELAEVRRRLLALDAADMFKRRA
jgi:CRP-like cAMP-binding protein